MRENGAQIFNETLTPLLSVWISLSLSTEDLFNRQFIGSVFNSVFSSFVWVIMIARFKTKVSDNGRSTNNQQFD